ncbi:glycoside hydrolase family 127 protein [Sedimentisphaera salicampi]|uniref:Non-reducing end beta-L-arabinofuranosidase n=1 Tax=Sedimentisphaera salicampi TaxID=1941349 RepID=A0A1W6LK79_9BACT|nr:beta-L-arabinofuranosidase domain-containing protein [Sedimentisphaera salicampi]ARN56165.1 hypothetical protein STSP1_00538 [Sedimentisphaera salicampi]OXU15743.1 hypothetical protein SMSP1_00532 [Sedimentisphaera salicampi]
MDYDNKIVEEPKIPTDIKAVVGLKGCCKNDKANKDTGIQCVDFNDVVITGGMWQHRQKVNREVTIRFVLKKSLGNRIDNFVNAASGNNHSFKGIFYDDSDVYKAIEGAAKCLHVSPDPEIETTVDEMIDKIASAQWEDGYLFTYYSLPERQLDKIWSDLEFKHELYCAGHLIEAALAYYKATGKDKLLNVAVRFADLICSLFGPGKHLGVPGHQEIEMALLLLYRETGKEQYLNLSKFFLEQRGNPERGTLYGTYSQDHKPIVEQEEAVGHAVRASYMYCAVADMALLDRDEAYLEALEKLWNSVVDRKMYLTGGVGAHHDLESYGDDYELPNDTAYAETCASIANIMWSDRMFRLNGDSKYIDIVERILYNGFLSGVSIDGDKFFYTNPLESDGQFKFNKNKSTRKPWFKCSCCPTNVVRFVPTISSYIYAYDQQNIFVNLFIKSKTSLKITDSQVDLEMKTDYPWDGKVRLEVNPQNGSYFTLRMRIPGWSQGKPVPGDLYRYTNDKAEKVSICVNGKEFDYQVENGYALINRYWDAGDFVEMKISMPIRIVRCNEKVVNNRGKGALERGPLVYCAEQIDNESSLDNIKIGDNINLNSEYIDEILGGICVLSGLVDNKGTEFKFVPYYSWSHRGEGAMKVWFTVK